MHKFWSGARGNPKKIDNSERGVPVFFVENRNLMAEYLSPGVYVEEFESGGKPMEGVSTSTAGFVGLAERGPVGGVPVLVTNFADFKRKFGGYLSAAEFGSYRFLSYCVEHFFLNLPLCSRGCQDRRGEHP